MKLRTSLVWLVLAALTLGACIETGKPKDNTLSLQSEQSGNNNLGTLDLGVDLPPANQLSPEEIAAMPQTVILKTSKGDITLKLYREDAPNTVKNFTDKAASGYYDKLTFHRVEDWVVQGGDPDGNGTGGGTMPTELNQTPFKLGSLGVARGGDIKVSNDSQFFICTDDCTWLTGQYTNFGEVVDGLDIAQSIEIGDIITGIVPVDE